MSHISSKKRVENLLGAPYPFEHNQYKMIYEKSKISLCNTNVYQCNFCSIKILGENDLLKHNKSFEHQNKMEEHIMQKLLQRTANKQALHCWILSGTWIVCIKLNLLFVICCLFIHSEESLVKFSEPVKQMLHKSALQTSKMKLYEELSELKRQYENYARYPELHGKSMSFIICNILQYQ